MVRIQTGREAADAQTARLTRVMEIFRETEARSAGDIETWWRADEELGKLFRDAVFQDSEDEARVHWHLGNLMAIREFGQETDTTFEDAVHLTFPERVEEWGLTWTPDPS